MSMILKFKGKRVDNGEWIVGDGIHYPKSINYIGTCWIDGGLPVANDWVQVIPETVCLFTGRCDKNGKEIYKNDIVYAHMNNKYYLVSHGLYFNIEIDRDGENTDCYGWFIKWKDEDLYGESLEGSDKWLSVVGNNYDNPELLK